MCIKQPIACPNILYFICGRMRLEDISEDLAGFFKGNKKEKNFDGQCPTKNVLLFLLISGLMLVIDGPSGRAV